MQINLSMENCWGIVRALVEVRLCWADRVDCGCSCLSCRVLLTQRLRSAENLKEHA